MNKSSLISKIRTAADRCLSRLVGPKSDREILGDLAGHALAGMLANPEWMALAKEECRKPGNGDVPNFFADCAMLYARRTLDKLPNNQGQTRSPNTGEARASDQQPKT